jgi:hypothetical protein
LEQASGNISSVENLKDGNEEDKKGFTKGEWNYYYYYGVVDIN